MRYLAPVCALTLMVAACDAGPGHPSPLPVPSVLVTPSPPPPPPPSPPPAPPRAITVGEEVTATYVGADLAFELTAPASGTLVATLSWDAWGTDSLLALVIGDTRFLFSEPDPSPIVGRAWVTAGTRHPLVVELVGTGMEVDVPFVLKTWME